MSARQTPNSQNPDDTIQTGRMDEGQELVEKKYGKQQDESTTKVLKRASTLREELDLMRSLGEVSHNA